MPIERTQARLWLVILGLTVLFAAGSFWPQYRQQQQLQARIGVAQARLQADRAGVGDMPALVKEIGGIERELQANPRQVPADNDVAELLRQLCNLMNDHHLTDQQVVTQPIQHGKDYSLMPLRLEFKGRFSEVYRFLQKIESLPRMVRVSRVALGRDATEAQAPVTGSLDLSAVFAPPRETQP